MYYTLDGSTPAAEAGGSTRKLDADATTLTVTPDGNSDQTVTVKAIAVKNGKSSAVAEKSLEFVAISENDTGTKVYEGAVTRTASGQSGGPYTVKVRVTTVDGKIVRVEDNDTINGIDFDADNADIDWSFWEGYNPIGDGDYNYEDSMAAHLKGKTLADVLNMKTVPNNADFNIDACSGATAWSDSIRYAVIAALCSEPVSESTSAVTPPTLSGDAVCVLNKSGKTIDVTMTAEADTTIHYTLDGSDPTIDSPTAEEIGWYGDVGVELTADPTTHPDGQIVEVRAAAFDAEGNASAVVKDYFVFANTLQTFSYKGGSYSGSADGVQATVSIESPNFDGNMLVTEISLDGSALSPEQGAELLSRVYKAQATSGVKAASDDETKVLAAIQEALDQALTASTPTITCDPEKSSYANGDQVTVTLGCATDGAEIYYTIDRSTSLSGGMLSDPTKTGTLYEAPLTVNIEDIAGGTVYICAAAKLADGQWSEIEREDLTFVKGVKEDAFVVDGQPYSSWKDAVDALATASKKTLTLNDDVALTAEDRLPETACTITSGEGGPYKLSGSAMSANADLIFDNLTYAITRIYANGHNITVNANVTTPWSWSAYGLYAGGNQTATETAGTIITVNAGNFEIVASGNGGTTLTGDVTVNVGGTAEVELAGATMNATVNGNVRFNLDGSQGAALTTFLGEQNGGTINGALTLKIIGAPTISSYGTFKASVNKESFGTLDLRGAEATVSADRFSGFATVLTAESEDNA